MVDSLIAKVTLYYVTNRDLPVCLKDRISDLLDGGNSIGLGIQTIEKNFNWDDENLELDYDMTPEELEKIFNSIKE